MCLVMMIPWCAHPSFEAEGKLQAPGTEDNKAESKEGSIPRLALILDEEWWTSVDGCRTLPPEHPSRLCPHTYHAWGTSLTYMWNMFLVLKSVWLYKGTSFIILWSHLSKRSLRLNIKLCTCYLILYGVFFLLSIHNIIQLHGCVPFYISYLTWGILSSWKET